jgi:hypothetical protein
VKEHWRLQFRGELFNIFNHPNFAQPTNNLTSALFGISTSILGRSLGSGGINGGFAPIYQIGGPRSRATGGEAAVLGTALGPAPLRSRLGKTVATVAASERRFRLGKVPRFARLAGESACPTGC